MNKTQTNKTQERKSGEEVRILLFVLAIAMILLLSGCANKEQLVKVEYQDVYVPIRCNAQMPNKPKFNADDLNSAKELLIYYKQTEELLKRCIDE